MLWSEILINKQIAEDRITQILAAVFNIPESEIVFTADVITLDADATRQLVVEQTSLDGEFPSRLSLYLFEESLVDTEPMAIAQQLSRNLACQCLMSDDDINPYSWLLVDAGNVQKVMLDADALDDNDEFIIKKQTQLI
jgi:hypothetical protein